MKIERTFDQDLIRSIITHPKIYPFASDDSSPKADEFQPSVQDSIYYLTPVEDRIMGCFMMVPANAITFEVHTCILPEYWGTKAAEAAKLCAAWMFHNTPCRKIITHVPAYNRLAYRFAKQAGMTEEGLIKDSFLKDGRVYDQHLLGLAKG